MRPFCTIFRACRARPAALAAGAALLALGAPRPGIAIQEGERGPWQATAELTFTDANGNQNLSLFTTGFGVRHRNPESLALDLRLQARYGSSQEDGERKQVAESYRGALNLDLTPARRWTPFLHSTADHDPFWRLDLRLNTGAGAKLRVPFAESEGEAHLSLALLHSYESLRTEEGGTTTRGARWNLRLEGSRELGDGMMVEHSAQYQPVHGAVNDYLLVFETALAVMLTQRLAPSLSHEYDRDSTPPEGVHRDDRLLKAGVMIQL